MKRPSSPLVVLVLVVLLLPAGTARSDEDGGLHDLANVAGAERFPGGARAKAHLAREGFVVLPRYHRQMFSVYLDEELPYYVTCDSAHWTWQVLFGAALREVEGSLAKELETFAVRLHGRLRASRPATRTPLGEGHSLALAYAAVTARLLGEAAEVPAEVEERVAAEVRLVTEAQGLQPSPLFGGREEDYALYRPRGFYGDDPGTHPYFRARLWMGRRAFRIRDARETAAALVLVRAIVEDERLRELLAQGSELFDWLVGPPDDLTVDAYAAVMKEVMHGEHTDEALAEHFPRIGGALAGLPQPEINADMLPPAEWKEFRERTQGLRLLPLRRTPDAWLFQGLAEADPQRYLPTGLEVALALGSKRAGTHLEQAGAAGRRSVAGVLERREGFHERLGTTHYGDTLRAAGLLFDDSSPLLGAGEPGSGEAGTPVLPAPVFLRAAWRDRLLATGLGTWTALRHAWILHQKPAAMASGMFEYPPGVVEPAPRFFRALGGLARSFAERAAEAGLLGGDAQETLRALLPVLHKRIRTEPLTAAERNLYHAHSTMLHGVHYAQGGKGDFEDSLPGIVRRLEAWLAGERELDAAEKDFVRLLAVSRTKGHLEGFAALMEKLAGIAERELAGRTLTPEDVELVKGYGKRIARLNFVYDDPPYARKQMGIVTDVGSNPLVGARLIAALGAAMEIYVVLPHREGAHRLYRGGVYSYYEFASTDPVTDAEWRRRVTQRRTPPLPPWTASYVEPPDVEGLIARVRKGEVVSEVKDLRDVRIGEALLARLEADLEHASRINLPVRWRLRQLGAYADGPLHARVLDLLVAWLLRAQDGNTGDAATRTLAWVLKAEDRPRILDLLRTPPPDAVPRAGKRLVRVLSRGKEPPSAAEIDDLLAESHAAVRVAGLQILGELFERRKIGPGSTVADRALRLLESEQDPGVQRGALELLSEIARHVGARHAVAIASFLDSEAPAVRAAAAALLGRMGAVDQAERLLALLERPDQPPEVVMATARALGRSLRDTGRDEALADRSVDALIACYRRGGPLQVSSACLEGLGTLGGARAASVLGGLAAHEKLDVRYRRRAVEALGHAGEAALPYLFRLCFDETKSGGSVNGHELRLCDQAVEALEVALGREPADPWRWLGPEGRVQLLEKARAEARTRGYGP